MKMTFNVGGDNFADAIITEARKTKFYFGRDVSNHAVYQLKIEANGNTYETSFPVMIQDGEEWEFSRNSVRVVTENDQQIHWGAVLEKFVGYEGDRDFGQAGLDAFIAWLSSGTATVRIAIGGVTTDRNGVEHHNCTIVRASKVANEKPAATAPVPAPRKSSVVKKSRCPAPKAVATATREDAWEAYATGEYIKTDPRGEKFNDVCDSVIGGDSTFATPEDWAKCVNAFKGS